jgi:hypothetical protein
MSDIVLEDDETEAAEAAESAALEAITIRDLISDLLRPGDVIESDEGDPEMAERYAPRVFSVEERAERRATRLEARAAMSADEAGADSLLERARTTREVGREAARKAIERQRDAATIDEQRVVADALTAELTARFALWDATPKSRPAAEFAHEQAVAALIDAERVARDYPAWLADLVARGAEVKSEHGSKAEVIARAAALAEAYDDLEYRAAQARIEAGRRRSRDEGGRLYLEEQGGFGLFDPSLAGSLEALSAGTEDDDLVTGVLGRGELAILFGDSYTGKSFLALDWALSMAHGSPWLGRDVTEGKVLYIAMEGARTLHKRELAWSAHRRLPSGAANFTAYPRVVNLMHDDSVTALAGYIEREGFDLVIIDTLSRSLNGANENDTGEMGTYVAALSRLKEAREGCTVLAVHHSRKDDPEVMRGSGTLFAGVDRVLCWKQSGRSGGDERKLITQKDKSGEAARPVLASFLQVTPAAVLVESEGDGRTLVIALKNLIATGGTVMRAEFQERLVIDGIKPSIDAARMAVKREIEQGRMHEADGGLLPGPAA